MAPLSTTEEFVHHLLLQIANGGLSPLGQAIVRRLRDLHNCHVIWIAPNDTKTNNSGEDDGDVVNCDLTNSQESRRCLDEIWRRFNGPVDLVIYLEEDTEDSIPVTVGERIGDIGMNIQQMINVSKRSIKFKP